MNHNKIVCFTGHRKIPYSNRARLIRALNAEVARQIEAGATVFRAGGALGFDTLAAFTVLKHREINPQIRLELILPCPSQADGWSHEDRILYQKVLSLADSYLYVSQTYYDGVLHLRNRRLVEGADVCVAYLTRSSGSGSAYTSMLAIQSGLEYVNLGD